MNSEHIINDEWLGRIIRKNSYVLKVNRTFITKSREKNSEESQWLALIHKVPCFAFTKILPSDVEYIEFVENIGFRLIDTNVSFVKPVESGVFDQVEDGRLQIRFAGPKDGERTVDLARRSFIYSRFHLDRRYSRELANEVKAQWVASYFEGKRGDKMAIATTGDEVIGFLQLIQNEPDSFTIDLIAVDGKYKRMGIARGLIRFAESHYSRSKIVRVGTQLANMPSIKLYQKMGFSMDAAQYVFHYHNK